MLITFVHYFYVSFVRSILFRLHAEKTKSKQRENEFFDTTHELLLCTDREHKNGISNEKSITRLFAGRGDRRSSMENKEYHVKACTSKYDAENRDESHFNRLKYRMDFFAFRGDV